MESLVLDVTNSTEESVVGDLPERTVSCVEVSPDAIARLLRTEDPVAAVARTEVVAVRGRRRIPPTSGHALEKLGHAIEYLTDEFVHGGGDGGFSSPRVMAIQLLMSLNREVYYECPIVPRLSERIRHFVASAIGQ